MDCHLLSEGGESVIRDVCNIGSVRPRGHLAVSRET